VHASLNVPLHRKVVSTPESPLVIQTVVSWAAEACIVKKIFLKNADNLFVILPVNAADMTEMHH
jgi:hypothetical protein